MLSDQANPAEGRHARILLVDDEEANLRLLERILERGGYHHVTSTTDPREVPDLLRTFDPDVILLDLSMPHLDGFEVMQILARLIPRQTYLPILVLTADATPETRRRALASGAKDFLTKPLDVDEVLLRLANMVDIRSLHVQVTREKEMLEHRVRERTQELTDAYVDTFERLALAAEYRDDDTGHHTRRVGELASIVAVELGLPAMEVDLLRRAAGLHDIGKLGVPDAILLAPRKLTIEEFEQVKTHTAIGAKILGGSRSPLLNMAEEIAASHHERWDGSGYAGLAGSAIPVWGRITAVADVFDALTHERPYKQAWPMKEAIAEIIRQSGAQFDPDVVAAFSRVEEQMVATVVSIANPAESRQIAPDRKHVVVHRVPSVAAKRY